MSTMSSPIDNPTKLDKLGIWISSLCALHCLAVPLLIPMLPLLAGSIFAQAWFERTILVGSMAIGAVALLNGMLRYHGQVYPLLLLFSGGLIYWNKGMFGETFEGIIVALGALLIIAAHIINMRLCRQCECCPKDDFSGHLNKASKH